MTRSLVMVGLLLFGSSTGLAGEVKGRVEMPDACSPTVSPAVVTLEPIDASPLPVEAKKAPASVVLVNQHGLQFEPRVQVIRVGQTLRFTNQDSEFHNVHSLNLRDYDFNRSMAPNVPAEFVPNKPGLIKLVCDIHSHMRGYVVVTASPWAKVCKGGGTFRFADVPDGKYALNAWHEMGPPLRREVEVKGGELLDLGAVVLQGFPVVATTQASAVVRPWPEVIDRIGVLLSESREAARKPEGLGKARKLANDAYWGEFEASGMEIAVRRHLGFQRAGTIEGLFRDLHSAIKPVAEGKVPASDLTRRSGQLLVNLAKASDELKRLKISDIRDIGQSPGSAEVVAVPNASEQAGQVESLASSFRKIQGLADKGLSDDAASAMTDAYWTDFEPLERLLNVRRPQEVAPLESRFNAIRGKIDSGLKGDELAKDLEGLRLEVVAALGRCELEQPGFGFAFAKSLVTILREGVEVILLLTMLVALVAKAGQPKALGAIRWGIGIATAASILTAVGLNLLVSSAQGRTREVVEGAVMLAAAGVLFYVSYWLISQTQAKRWSDFLKEQVSHGAKVGGLWTLGLTAFLAVYREGAETALLYQGFISEQRGSREGLLGLGVGLAIGLVVLASVAILIRKTSVKLPLRPFFQVTGFILFAMAVIFAGNGVFELQSAGYVKTTALEWLGTGLPALGFHPNTQALSVQGLLMIGAVLAFALPGSSKPKPQAMKVSQPPAAGVGI